MPAPTISCRHFVERYARRKINKNRWQDELLHFVRVPPHHRSSETPIVWFDGGPGESVISDFSDGGIQGYPLSAALSKAHEILFLDQRGTGLSNQLQCPMYPRVSDVFAEIFPLDSVRRCRARLAKTSDLSAYGTDAAADDLDAVRRHPTFGRVIAIGGSYGTTAALVYMRRYPNAVQSALLSGLHRRSLRFRCRNCRRASALSTTSSGLRARRGLPCAFSEVSGRVLPRARAEHDGYSVSYRDTQSGNTYAPPSCARYSLTLCARRCTRHITPFWFRF